MFIKNEIMKLAYVDKSERKKTFSPDIEHEVRCKLYIDL